MTDEHVVVGAVIVDRLKAPTRVLTARRTSPPALAGKWEFPGGKVEPGEKVKEALRRELREELSVDANIGEEISHPTKQLWPASGGYMMRLFWTHLPDNSSVVLTGSHDSFRWLSVDDLHDVNWLESDLAVLPLLTTALT